MLILTLHHLWHQKVIEFPSLLNEVALDKRLSSFCILHIAEHVVFTESVNDGSFIAMPIFLCYVAWQINGKLYF